MNNRVRVTVTSALAVASLGVIVDAQAKVADKCIQTLEARPSRPDAPTTRPCPVAIGYTPRDPVMTSRHPAAHLPFDARAEQPRPAPTRA